LVFENVFFSFHYGFFPGILSFKGHGTRKNSARIARKCDDIKFFLKETEIQIKSLLSFWSLSNRDSWFLCFCLLYQVYQLQFLSYRWTAAQPVFPLISEGFLLNFSISEGFLKWIGSGFLSLAVPTAFQNPPHCSLAEALVETLFSL